MKSALSLVMIVCLVGSALPAGAEDGPLAKAAEREAVRLAAAKAQPSPTSTAVLEFPTGPGTPLELKWNELAPLIAGERVEVTLVNLGTVTSSASSRGRRWCSSRTTTP